jgi:hypothetical protein
LLRSGKDVDARDRPGHDELRVRSHISKHLEIFALFPVRDFGLEALDFRVLDVDVIVDEFRAQRVAEKWIILQREYRLAFSRSNT